MPYHSDSVSTREANEFKRWVDTLRNAYSWGDLARLTKANRMVVRDVAGGSAGFVKSSYERKPSRPLYDAMRSVYANFIKEEEMPRFGRPQLEKIVEWVRLHPGTTPKDTMQTLNGVGRLSIEAAIEKNLVVKRAGGLWVPEALPSAANGIPGAPIDLSPLQEKLQRALEASAAPEPVVIQLPDVVVAVPAGPNWAQLQREAERLISRLEAYALRKVEEMEGPTSLVELVRSEYSRSIVALTTVISKEFDLS